jgi:putative endonuclease
MVQTPKQHIGEIGEDIAVKHLVKHFFEILDRNYRKKWGEIDIVAQKNDILHFIEVKTVSHETTSEEARPEENVHLWKRQRLARAIKTYLLENKVPDEIEWQVDVMAIFLDFKIRKAKIRLTENIILV